MDYDNDLNKAGEFRRRAALAVKHDCRKHGLYGNVIYYAPSSIADSDRNRLYMIAGLDPKINDDAYACKLEPDKILRRSKRNQKLFYPKVWVYDLFENQNDMQVQQDLADYCGTAGFLFRLYAEYDAQLPEKLRISEVNQLIEYQSVLDNPAAPESLKVRYKEALDYFFKREKSRSIFRQKWLEYFRSEHFPDDKGAIGRIIGYFRRNSNQVDIKQLMEVNGDLHKLQMQEHEYKIFVELMRQKHPDVVFSVGDKDIVDHGLINSSRAADIYGRVVTGEEYAVIRKERFATEGFAALSGLHTAYWEFRDIYFKAADEALVAGIYHKIALSYAKCNSLMELKERGPVKMEQVPVSDFMNFVSLAKANGLRFYIDNDGDFANPSLETVNVLYNSCQESKWLGIRKRLIEDKKEFSHTLSSGHSSLSHTLSTIEQTTTGQKKKKEFSGRSR